MATDAVAAVPPLRARSRVTIDPRLLPPLLITTILVVAHLTFGILEGYSRTGLAIATAIAAELILGRAAFGVWPHPASAYITGISVGILLRSPFIWPYVLCSLISILTKYVLRYRGRHLWNPSNFGVSVVLLLAPDTVTLLSIQWGNAVAPMAVIWLLGAAIVWRVGRLHISASYAASFLLLAGVRAWVDGVPWITAAAPITGPMYQLFIFFMVTDPKTTVRSRRGQIIVVVLVAVVEMLLRLADVIYAPFYALFLVGPLAMVTEDLWAERRGALLAGDDPAGRPPRVIAPDH
jgi:Na+-translocating ferredoxin:NAD+ oxidoreductase RnfD subunit